LIDPPRRCANKQRGHGTYENDLPPMVGIVGRETGRVRLQFIPQTKRGTLEQHVQQFTVKGTTCYTNEWNGYEHIIRSHATVSHGRKEWARDDYGDGKREDHINTSEGMWTDVRTFLRSFKGLNKHFLSGYLAILFNAPF